MLRLLGRFLYEFLFDEGAGKRHFSTLCFVLGLLLIKGGNVWGTEIVFVWMKDYMHWGMPLLVLGHYVASGGKLPGGETLHEAAQRTTSRLFGNGSAPPTT